MSKETRTIRPFVGLSELEGVIDEVALHFGQETCLANEGILVDLTPHEFLLRPVSIEWASDAEAFGRFQERLRSGAKQTGYKLDDLSLVVIASTSFLKIADVVFDCLASQLGKLKRVVDLTEPARSPAFSAPFNGFTVDAYLVLTRSIDNQPLRPSRKGTWIAWSQFRVKTSQAPAVLPPTPLTDEIRERHRLPAKTIRYLYFGDHNPIEPYAEQEQPVFYIDEKLLAQMNARRRSAASKALQLQLVHDFAAAVIRRAAVNPELSDVGYDDLQNTLLGSVIRIAAGPGASDLDRDRLVSDVRDQPEYVLARAEHSVDMLSGYSGLLKENDT